MSENSEVQREASLRDQTVPSPDNNFSTPPRENSIPIRPARASEIYPSVRRRVPEQRDESPERNIRYVFAELHDPYEGNRPKLSGHDRHVAVTKFVTGTYRERLYEYVRKMHPNHARFLDACGNWEKCFISGN